MCTRASACVCACGEGGGSQAGWGWLPGGEEAQKKPPGACEGGGEQAVGTTAPPCGTEGQSEARSLENMVMVSGKLGGVAGVLRGVHIIWWWCPGMLVSWKKELKAVSNCQCAA